MLVDQIWTKSYTEVRENLVGEVGFEPTTKAL